MTMTLRAISFVLGGACGLCACGQASGGRGDGTLTVLVDAEDTIIEGIAPGAGVENLLDGWRADFERYLVAIGDVELRLARDPDITRHEDRVTVVDLAGIGNQGLILFELGDLAAADWQISYRTAGAGDGAERGDGVTRADFDAMVDADASYLIVGSLSQQGGQSCPPAGLAEPPDDRTPVSEAQGVPCYDNPHIEFGWAIPAETTFGPCRVDGMEGFSVPSGGRKRVSLSIHGDHMFFNGFPQGTEGGIERRAQWIADCDLNLDGEVTRDELEAIPPPDLAAIADYDLNVPFEPLRPVDNMWTYLRAQLKGQGHLDGEGECDADSVGHEH